MESEGREESVVPQWNRTQDSPVLATRLLIPCTAAAFLSPVPKALLTRHLACDAGGCFCSGGRASSAWALPHFQRHSPVGAPASSPGRIFLP